MSRKLILYKLLYFLIWSTRFLFQMSYKMPQTLGHYSLILPPVPAGAALQGEIVGDKDLRALGNRLHSNWNNQLITTNSHCSFGVQSILGLHFLCIKLIHSALQQLQLFPGLGIPSFALSSKLLILHIERLWAIPSHRSLLKERPWANPS